MIIHFPGDIPTRARIDQAALRRLSWAEVTITKPRESGLLGSLDDALQELRTATDGPERDIRWGIFLIDSEGRERASVFLDSRGNHMQIGDSRLRVQGRTLAWIKKSIRIVLR